MGWLILLAVLCALPFVPLGFCAIYREKDPGVWLLIGPVQYRIYPDNDKSKPRKGKRYAKKDLPETGGGHLDFDPVLRDVLKFLRQFRRKIRVNNLIFKITLAGDDPCDLALNYGRTWAALGTLVPQLERLFIIKRRDLSVDCDYNSDKTRVYVKVIATITLGRIILSLLKTQHKNHQKISQIENEIENLKGGA